VITEIEPHGDRIRVRAGELSADVTARAVAELDLVPGTRVTFSVKANEVSAYPL
jgi:molybdate transport system ATP-binding protein